MKFTLILTDFSKVTEFFGSSTGLQLNFRFWVIDIEGGSVMDARRGFKLLKPTTFLTFWLLLTEFGEMIFGL